MQVTIPPEFEAFAREQVEAGTFASTEEAVLEEVRVLIDEGLSRGDPVDGETFLRELLAGLHGRDGRQSGFRAELLTRALP